jgi:large subunit ribosomal protein L31
MGFLLEKRRKAQSNGFTGQRTKAMKKEIHPKLHKVIFKDMGADFAFLTTSTKTSPEKMKWTDGHEYPVLKVDISSASHPFFTGKMKLIDAEGRVDRFNKKYSKK